MTKRSGFIAVIGAPNAGKSTLVNTMVGAKVAIVTHKVQTTRTRLLGIALHGESQLIFVDTPGIFAPRRRLDRAMVQAAWRGAEDADLVVLVIDAAKGLDEEGERICDGLRRAGRRCLIALNKIDRVKKPALLALAERLGDMGIADEIFMVSALKGEGVADLKAALAAALPEGPWLFPEDQITDVTNRVLAAEITREKGDAFRIVALDESTTFGLTQLAGDVLRWNFVGMHPIFTPEQTRAIGERAVAILEEALAEPA